MTTDLLLAHELWRPSQSAVNKTSMKRFHSIIKAKYGLSSDSYNDLYEWSINNVASFWEEIWNFVHIRCHSKYTSIVSSVETLYPPPKWFVGCTLNFAENIIEPFATEDYASKPAIIQTDELGLQNVITFGQLKEHVSHMVALLSSLGVKSGDAVAAYAPNRYEVVIFMLAAASLGAVYTASSPDFGPQAVYSRFSQIPNLKVLLASSHVYYNGKVQDHNVKLNELMNLLKDHTSIIVLLLSDPRFEKEKVTPLNIPHNSEALSDALAKSSGTDYSIPYAHLPFDHPLYILYSSGSTGTPKCIVHSVGGTLIQHKKEHILHGDMKPGDSFLQITTIAWMMWHWSVSVLSAGATLVLYDGSPFLPSPLHLWSILDELRISHFGTSAKYLQILQEKGIHPKDAYLLANLRVIFSTGSPLHPNSFEFVYSSVKQDLQLSSITGGTDIVSLFAGGNPALPVYKGQIQCRCLGMAVESWNNHKKALIGEPGDLVCTKPFPCMPIYFGCDPDGCKYRDAYFNIFKNVWHHGDYIYIHPDTKGIVMLGRSDGTLNPAGVRFGSAELYNTVACIPEIEDSLAVGQWIPYSDDERVLFFVKLKSGFTFTKELKERINLTIRNELSPRHVPSMTLATPEIPYTLNGKKAEVVVKKVLSGKVKNIDALSQGLESPSSLSFYESIYHQGLSE